VKTTDELIQTYLNDLKAALAGADKATVQDALADAEEHLRTALENEKGDQEDVAENEVVKGVIQTYGEAEEIAQAYLSWEQNLPPALAATPAARRVAGSAYANDKAYPGFFGVFADPRAWGGLVYMLISLVTGTLYFSWAVTGLSTSLGLMILIIGIPFAILFLLSVRGLSFLEGRLVEALLGERMPQRASFTDNSLPWKERLKHLLTGKSTWLWLDLYDLDAAAGHHLFHCHGDSDCPGSGLHRFPNRRHCLERPHLRWNQQRGGHLAATGLSDTADCDPGSSAGYRHHAYCPLDRKSPR